MHSKEFADCAYPSFSERDLDPWALGGPGIGMTAHAVPARTIAQKQAIELTVPVPG